MKTWRHALLVIGMAALGGGFPLFAMPQDSTFSHEFNPPPLPQVEGEMAERLTPLGAPDILSEDTSTPEITIFDIYVGGVQYGSAMASYTGSWVQIENPDGLLSQLPDTKHPDQLVKFLTGELVNGKETKGVGKLNYRPDQFRIEVTLAPEMLFLATLSPGEDIPQPAKELVLSQTLLLNASTNTNAEANASGDKISLRHRGAVSFGTSRLITEGTLEENDYTLTNLALSHDEGEVSYTAGFLETTGQSFATSKEFLGAKISTISELRSRNENLQSSALVVFVPTRSRVEVFRDGQLLFSRLVDFGLQEIDTSRFPSGSYTVEIVVTDDSGNVTRNNQFYTKTTQLVPRGKPYFSASAGVTREDAFNLNDTFIAQAETRIRLTGILETGLSLYATDKVASGEISLNGLWNDLFFGAGYTYTSENDSGIRANASYVGSNLGLSLNYLKTLQGFNNTVRLNSQDNILSKPREQLSADITYNLNNLSLGLKGTRSEALGEVTRYSWGPQVSYKIYQDGSHRLELRGDYFRTNEGPQSSALLAYSWVPLGGQWSASASTSQRRQNNDRANYSSASLSYDSGYNSSQRVTGQLTSEVGDDTTTSLQSAYENNHFKVSGYANNSSNSGNTALGLEAQTTIIAYASGYTHAAADIDASAGLLATFSGNATGAQIDIFVNDSFRGTGAVGETLAIGLEPYKTYKVNISPNDPESMFEYDSRPRYITVYPGNMQHQNYEIGQALLLFGRIITPDNAPMSQVKITGGKYPIYTDEFGFFEAETNGKEQYTATTPEGQSCQVELPPLSFDKQFYNIGDAICH